MRIHVIKATVNESCKQVQFKQLKVKHSRRSDDSAGGVWFQSFGLVVVVTLGSVACHVAMGSVHLTYAYTNLFITVCDSDRRPSEDHMDMALCPLLDLTLVFDLT